MMVSTARSIEPRCTGMCGALATSRPSAENTAQEKSSRSLMLTEYAVFCSDTPICSAIDMNRLLNTSSMIGSALVPTALVRFSATTRLRTRWFLAVISARQPSSSTMVWCGSMMMAGAFDLWPGGKWGRGVNPAVGPFPFGEKCARRKLGAGVDRGVVPFAIREELRALNRGGDFRPRDLVLAFGEFGAAADRFDRDGLDDQLLGPVDEAEPRLVGFLEGRFHLGERSGFHHQRRVGAVVANVGADDHLDLRCRHALAGDLGFGLFAEPAALALDGGERLGPEIFLDRELPAGADVGEPHAVSRQQ